MSSRKAREKEDHGALLLSEDSASPKDVRKHHVAEIISSAAYTSCRKKTIAVNRILMETANLCFVDDLDLPHFVTQQRDVVETCFA